MISADQNNACRIIAEEALRNPLWFEYGMYCTNRELGLRKLAFTHLDFFLSATKLWSYGEKRNFVKWLCDKMDSIKDASYGPYPTPLVEQLFKPFFDEWILKEPEAEVYALKAQYTSDYDSYYTALQFDPENQRSRIALARQCVHDISYCMHHLPEYFIGDENKVRVLFKEVRSHIEHITDELQKCDILEDLQYQEQLFEDWISFKSEGESNFDEWCKARNRRYTWIKAYYYDA